jgi:hypothetical protein
MSRKTIGEDILNQLDESPIDLLTTPLIKNGEHARAPEVVTEQVKEKSSKGKGSHESALLDNHKASQTKERMTIQISRNTIERVKDCVYWNRLTIAQFVEDALEEALKIAEKENGKPFQKRRSELKPGRPTK